MLRVKRMRKPITIGPRLLYTAVRFPFWMALLPLLGPPAPAESASLSARNRLSFSISRSDITGRGGDQQSIDLGTVNGGQLLPGNVVSLPLDPQVGINTTVRKRHNRTWRLQFANGEWRGPINIQVDYRLRDTSNREGFVSDPNSPNSAVAVSVSSARITTRERGNGSLNWVRGDTFFDINLLTAETAGVYSGTLTIDVTFN